MDNYIVKTIFYYIGSFILYFFLRMFFNIYFSIGVDFKQDLIIWFLGVTVVWILIPILVKISLKFEDRRNKNGKM